MLGLIGGAAYIGKTYFLDKRWPDDVRPIAEDVAEQRGLEWERAVPVEALPAGQYALRLAESMLGVTAADTAALSVEWRAMGLAEGSIDLAAIGSAALAEQPAFYDPASETVYIIEGLSTDLREIVLTRALGNALLDQHFDWGTTIATASGESVRLGVRALFDGDALGADQRHGRDVARRPRPGRGRDQRAHHPPRRGGVVGSRGVALCGGDRRPRR